MLFLVGLGLADERDITAKGLDVVRRCSKVILEHYTSLLLVPKEKLEELYGRSVELADREMMETGIDTILDHAREEDVALLVVGDPFGATTHSDLVLRAASRSVPVKVIHNASIMNAMGCCGLQLYHFGPSVSIVFFTEAWRPESFFDKLCDNLSRGCHTLCLLDIKVKEQSIENLARGRKIYEPPRFMSVNTALEQILEVSQKRKSKCE